MLTATQLQDLSTGQLTPSPPASSASDVHRPGLGLHVRPGPQPGDGRPARPGPPLPSPRWAPSRNALTTAQIGALKETQIGAMTTAQAGMTTDQIHAITSVQVHSLSTQDIAAMSMDQLNARARRRSGDEFSPAGTIFAGHADHAGPRRRRREHRGRQPGRQLRPDRLRPDPQGRLGGWQ